MWLCFVVWRNSVGEEGGDEKKEEKRNWPSWWSKLKENRSRSETEMTTSKFRVMV